MACISFSDAHRRRSPSREPSDLLLPGASLGVDRVIQPHMGSRTPKSVMSSTSPANRAHAPLNDPHLGDPPFVSVRTPTFAELAEPGGARHWSADVSHWPIPCEPTVTWTRLSRSVPRRAEFDALAPRLRRSPSETGRGRSRRCLIRRHQSPNRARTHRTSTPWVPRAAIAILVLAAATIKRVAGGRSARSSAGAPARSRRK